MRKNTVQMVIQVYKQKESKVTNQMNTKFADFGKQNMGNTVTAKEGINDTTARLKDYNV